MPPSRSTWPVWWRVLLADRLFLLLALAMPALAWTSGTPLGACAGLVNWPTIATLAGLLMLTKGIELSGLLQRAAHHLLLRMHSERGLALLLVASAELSAMLLTNDVALFILVPLTLGLHAMARKLPTVRLVVFQALAVNAGSTLTPIGNPQNLFLWQVSGVGFGSFVLTMAPLAALLSVLMLTLTVFSFSGRPIDVEEDLRPAALDLRLAWVSLLLFPAFLILIDQRLSGWALALVTLSYLARYRSVPARCDWNLILVFILMFIDLRLMARLEDIRRLLAAADWSAYAGVIVVSQLISNVPAAILLSGFHGDWRGLAWGANVGGYGWMLGSLANLIALRMLNMNRSWLVFHLYSIPFLAVAALLAGALLAR
jgi:di/tricarboxylate transporter